MLRLSVGVLTACKLIETEIQSGSWGAIKTSHWWQKYPNISNQYQYQIQYPINILGGNKDFMLVEKIYKNIQSISNTISNQDHGGQYRYQTGGKTQIVGTLQARQQWMMEETGQRGRNCTFSILHLCKII